MKNLIITLALLLYLISYSYSQTPYAKSYIERTHVGLKNGTAVGVAFSNQIELAAFYQESASFERNKEKKPRIYEKEFFGFYFSYPLKHSAKTGLDINIKTGVINKQYMAIMPTLIAFYQPIKLIKIGTGVGVRSLRATYQASILVSLNNRK